MYLTGNGGNLDAIENGCFIRSLRAVKGGETSNNM